jgi:hypothetical protein
LVIRPSHTGKQGLLHVSARGQHPLLLDAGRKLNFPGDAPLSVSGDLVVLTGAPTAKERLRVQADGDVSIGTAEVNARLEVHGDLTVSGLINGSDVATLRAQVETLQQQVAALTGSLSSALRLGNATIIIAAQGDGQPGDRVFSSTHVEDFPVGSTFGREVLAARPVIRGYHADIPNGRDYWRDW